MEKGSQNGPQNFWAVNPLGSLFPSFSQPFPKIDFLMHLGRSLAPFWSLLAPFGVIWALFWALLATFSTHLGLLVPFGAENGPATHFYRFSQVFHELGDVLVDFDTIPKTTHTTAPQTHNHKTWPGGMRARALN